MELERLWNREVIILEKKTEGVLGGKNEDGDCE